MKAVGLLIVLMVLSACSADLQMTRAPQDKDSQEHSDKIAFAKRVITAIDHDALKAELNTEDGIDQYEAWLVTSAYVQREFGACNDVRIPKLKGDNWISSVFAGRSAEQQSPVYVSASTGSITCEGHKSVSDPRPLFESHWSQIGKNGDQRRKRWPDGSVSELPNQ